MIDSVNITDIALAAAERGETIYALEMHATRHDAEHVIVVASNAFWLICAHALRQAAANAAPDDDAFEGAYRLLTDTAGIKLPEESTR